MRAVKRKSQKIDSLAPVLDKLFEDKILKLKEVRGFQGKIISTGLEKHLKQLKEETSELEFRKQFNNFKGCSFDTIERNQALIDWLRLMLGNFRFGLYAMHEGQVLEVKIKLAKTNSKTGAFYVYTPGRKSINISKTVQFPDIVLARTQKEAEEVFKARAATSA